MTRAGSRARNTSAHKSRSFKEQNIVIYVSSESTNRTRSSASTPSTATLFREQTLTIERLEDLHDSLVARPAENEKAKVPRDLKISLMPDQQYALAWMIWREKQKPRGGVLADDMGLGKTLTNIALAMASIAKSTTGEESNDEDDWKENSFNEALCKPLYLIV